MLPAGIISSITCEGEGVGAVRDIQLSAEAPWPGQVVERLDVAYDERVFAYSIVGTPSLPLEDYVAVVELEDTADGGCRARWGSNWVITGDISEAEMAEALAGLYDTILGAIS